MITTSQNPVLSEPQNEPMYCQFASFLLDLERTKSYSQNHYEAEVLQHQKAVSKKFNIRTINFFKATIRNYIEQLYT